MHIATTRKVNEFSLFYMPDLRDAAIFSRFQLRFAQNDKQQSLFVTHHYTVSRFSYLSLAFRGVSRECEENKF